ncbi:MAG: dicarboxylate/amino acid:cation symporter, partial [bacterium]|nr:dicarboxylate/amino acid:cation symporter [bacterium]
IVVGAVANLASIDPLTAALVAVEPIGTAFIRLITMIVIPLIVASILLGSASMGDLTRLGRIGGKTVLYYMFTTAAAVSLGLLLSNLVRPGSRIDPGTRDQLASQFTSEASAKMTMAQDAPSVTDVLLGIIPPNPVKAAADFDLLALIFFSVVFGAAISILDKDKKTVVLKFFEGINDASMVVIRWIMLLAPYAVFVLIAAVLARFGLDLLKSLLVYTLLVLAGLALHIFVTLALMVRFAARLNVASFFRRIAAVQLFGFSVSSSNATLPLTMRTAENKLGISKGVSSFVLPMGATINMDGTALYQAVAVMFIAQIYGIPLDPSQQLIVVLTATLASVGAAGVPGVGIITLIIVLQSVGLGDHVESGIALILGVDRILDMSRTIVNVTGDLSCAAFIARTEGEIHFPEKDPGNSPA